jgi:hypothetical protein
MARKLKLKVVAICQDDGVSVAAWPLATTSPVPEAMYSLTRRSQQVTLALKRVWALWMRISEHRGKISLGSQPGKSRSCAKQPPKQRRQVCSAESLMLDCP